MRHQIRHTLIICSALLLWAGSSIAQDDDEGMTCTICFDDDEGIELSGSAESGRELTDNIRKAEVPVREYIQSSLDNSERGTARALRDFRAWYEYRVAKQNAHEFKQRAIANLVGRVLGYGLDFFLPGSGTVVTHLRDYGQQAYNLMADTLPAGDTKPGSYLDKLAGRLENNNDRMKNWLDDMFHDTQNQPLQDQIETIKFEYVLEKMAQRLDGEQGATRRTPGPSTRSLLRTLGIQPPTSRNYADVRRTVLEDMVFGVLCAENQGNKIHPCPKDRWYYEAYTESQTLRLIVSGARPDKMGNLTDPEHLTIVCPAEWKRGLFMNADCRKYRSRRR